MNRLGTCCLALVLALASAGSASAQGGTDVWLIPLVGSGDQVEIGQPTPVTTRPGYDNQPTFSLDGSVLYYTANIDGQTDIWRVSIDGEGKRSVSPRRSSEPPRVSTRPQKSRIAGESRLCA